MATQKTMQGPKGYSIRLAVHPQVVGSESERGCVVLDQPQQIVFTAPSNVAARCGWSVGHTRAPNRKLVDALSG
jgi:hypothetical protein